MSDLFHTQAASEHDLEDGTVSRIFYGGKKSHHVLIAQMAGQGSGHSKSRPLFYRVDDREAFLMMEVVVEPTDPLKMAVDGFRLEPSSQQVIRVLGYFPVGHRLKRNLQPQDELPQHGQVVLDRVSRVVPPLEKTSVVDDRMGQVHVSPPAR